MKTKEREREETVSLNKRMQRPFLECGPLIFGSSLQLKPYFEFTHMHQNQ